MIPAGSELINQKSCSTEQVDPGDYQELPGMLLRSSPRADSRLKWEVPPHHVTAPVVHLTCSLRSLVSYGVKHSKKNSMSTRAYVLFSLPFENDDFRSDCRNRRQ